MLREQCAYIILWLYTLLIINYTGIHLHLYYYIRIQFTVLFIIIIFFISYYASACIPSNYLVLLLFISINIPMCVRLFFFLFLSLLFSPASLSGPDRRLRRPRNNSNNTAESQLQDGMSESIILWCICVMAYASVPAIIT